MTTSTKHNKKRNVGIIYELLLREISSGIVEDDKSVSEKSMDILKRHFKAGSELYKEFRLFNALVKTTATSDEVAQTILGEARKMACSMDIKKLDKEKTSLIHSVNHNLNKEKFYGRNIPEYRMYATIQTVLNNWRSPKVDNIVELAEFETNVRTWLKETKIIDSIESHYDVTADPLVTRLMSEKINEKFAHVLNEEQKDIVRTYIMHITGDETVKLNDLLENVKKETLARLDEYIAKEDNEVINEKSSVVRKDIEMLVLNEEITDEMIAKFLVVSQLKKTLVEGETL